MQATSDIFLGWLHVDAGLDDHARDFYVRQLKDWKGSAEIERMVPKAMATYGSLCGWTLARAHARSGDRIAIAAYLGNGDSFDRALIEFSKERTPTRTTATTRRSPPRPRPAGSPSRRVSDADDVGSGHMADDPLWPVGEVKRGRRYLPQGEGRAITGHPLRSLHEHRLLGLKLIDHLLI